jgi:L-asparaginase / beta-aspartyl-peptidase
VSSTGIGEFFMRGVVAYDIAARMKYRGLSVSDAVDQTIHEVLDACGEGGVIALDGKGNMKFRLAQKTEGMYGGYMKADGKPVVQIYRE